MLSLLMDENLSPEVARQIRNKRQDIFVISLLDWHEGQYLAQQDDVILAAAVREALTLVTYDQKTILMDWGLSGTDHAGIIFVDDRSIASNNFGTLVRSLILLWDTLHTDDWANRIEYLRPAGSETR